MTGVDSIKALLITYGYYKDISIKITNSSIGISYEIDATNPEEDDELYIISDGYMGALYDITSYMYHTNVCPCEEFEADSIKNVLDDEFREKKIEKKNKTKENQEDWNEKHNWCKKIRENEFPCDECKLNKKDHWDSIHNNCPEAHYFRCSILRTWMDKSTHLYMLYDKKGSDEANAIIEELKDNKKKALK